MKKFRQVFQNLSLRSKLILSSIGCILLPLILSFALMNRLVQDELVQQAIDQSEDTIELLNLQLVDYFDNLLYLSNYIQFDDQIKSILNRNIERSKKGQTTPELEALDYIEISRNLEGVSSLLVHSYLTIVLDDHFTYTNYAHTAEQFSFYRDMYLKIKAQSSYGLHWIGIHDNYVELEKDKYPYLISIAGWIDLTEKSKALQIISIYEKEIRSLLNERAFDHEQELLLIDSDGVVVSHSQNELVNMNFPFWKKLSEEKAYHVVRYHEKDYLMVSRPFSYGNWRVVSLIPHRTAVGNIQKVMGNTLFLLLSFFILFLFILVLLVSLLTKPLKILNRVIKEVNRGNLNVRSGITGNGDIEQLGRSLDTMMDTIEQMIEQIRTVEKSKHKAELEMLQAQINPHFLFNTLNSLRLKILLNGDLESSKLIQSLAQLLRMTINRNCEFVSLEKEIEIIEHYLKLMNFKGNSQVELETNLNEETLEFEVPCFFLQPFIENSIIHGLEQKSGKITILSRMEERGIRIVIVDNGKGIAEEDLEQIHAELQATPSTDVKKNNNSSFTGIGIRNVYQRMRLIYGYNFQMNIENQPLGGVQISFYIPRNQGV